MGCQFDSDFQHHTRKDGNDGGVAADCKSVPKGKHCWFESNSFHQTHWHIAQSAEATDLESVQCEFESHFGYQIICGYGIRVVP